MSVRTMGVSDIQPVHVHAALPGTVRVLWTRHNARTALRLAFGGRPRWRRTKAFPAIPARRERAVYDMVVAIR